jgi:hypothetical protein
MAFDARKVAGELAREPFEFTGMDGRTYTLPNINTLTGAQARRFMAGDESVIEEVANPAAVAALDAMPLNVQEQLARAWISYSGESGKGASPSSRPRRRRRR